MYYKKIKEPEINNICAIVVTYNPDEQLPERIEHIVRQVKKVVIVDNNSSSECRKMLKKISTDLDIHLIFNNDNLGVATALNYGFDYAINSNKSFEWCLTMDQDTIIYPEMVQALITAYKDCYFREEVGIIGSNYEEFTTGKVLFKNKKNNISWAEVEHLPTSGCLISISMYNYIGNFRDDLFIDYIDTEYCMRTKEMGYKVIISPHINMKHPLGYYKYSNLSKYILGRDMITNYPPIRHYYWTRNGIILIRENFWKSMKWSLYELYYILIRRIFIVLIFEDKKIQKLNNIFLGILHAFVPHSSKLRV